MFFKSAKTKMTQSADERMHSFLNPRHRAQSAVHLLSPDSTSVKSGSPQANRSLTPSSASSTSSLAVSSSPKSSLSSFLKVATPSHDESNASPSDDRFVMTIIKSPSPSSHRAHTHEPVASSTVSEDLSSNNKFLKSKMTAALNHMKYRESTECVHRFEPPFVRSFPGWVVKMRPNFRTDDSPICLLGRMYSGCEGECSARRRTLESNVFVASETTHDDNPRPQSEQSYASFLKALSQRIYFSYRKQFEPFTGARNGDIITSDGGWGCMIRCAQMLLAQTLLMQMTNTFNTSYSNIQIAEKCK